MQRYAHAALKDGLDMREIETLASLANFGKNPPNAERDFHRNIDCLFNCQFPLYSMVVEIYDADHGVAKPVEVPVLLASTVLHELHKKNNAKLWKTCIGATAEQTSEFWNAFKTDPKCSWKHPVFERFSLNSFFHCFFFQQVIPSLSLFESIGK